MNITTHWIRLSAISLTAVGCLWGQAQVIATGLQSPMKILLTPGGNFLVSEDSTTPNSGRISIVTRAGVRRSLIEGLPSGLDVAGSPNGPTAMALRDRTLYVAIGGGDAERRPAGGGPPMHNPQGTSSPIFTSVLDIRLNADVDSLNAPFRMTPAHQQSLADRNEVELTNEMGAQARISVLADFPDSIPEGSGYRFSNPWGLALSSDGNTLWVTDASQNSLIRVNTANGRWQRLMRFDPVPNPGPTGPRMIDAVPTSVRLYGDQLLVSFLVGFPFPPGSARVLAVNPEQRTTEPFIFARTSATDVLWRTRADGSSQFFVLEFSQNQSAQPAAPGRLVRFDSSTPQVVVSDLQGPVSLAFDSSTEDLFILELSGRILQISVR
jgi:hypothetical protein